VSHLTKTETFLVIWLNIVAIVDRSVRLCHSSIALSMMVWSMPCQHAENAASVHNTCLHKIVCYLQRIFKRNRKL